MQSFWQFMTLMEADHRSKYGLYPFAYDGIGNYPPAAIITHSADAIYYLDQDDRFHSWWEGSPFSITHIPSPGEVKPPQDHNMPGTEKPFSNKKPDGKVVKPHYKLPAGQEVKPTQWVKLVTNPVLLNPKHIPDQKLARWKG